MLDVRFLSIGLMASTTFLLGAPVTPPGCGGSPPGGTGGVGGGPPGGTAGVGGSSPQATCGNGRRDRDWGEECDGTDFGGDVCATFSGYVGGALECTSYCRRDLSSCKREAYCGNTYLDEGEECEAGFRREYTKCSELDPRLPDKNLFCTSDCRYDRARCEDPSPACGDGIVDPSEQCEDFNLAGATCAQQFFANSIFGVPTNYASGFLFCGLGCRFNLSNCVPPPGCYLRGGGGLLPPVLVCY
jgi:hypothetical protein